MYSLTLLFIIISGSYAQLMLPPGAVCAGEQVVFVCQQTFFTRWTVFLPGGTTYELTNAILPSQAETVLFFQDDPFGFEIHVSSSSSNTTTFSELRVTAVGQLNGSTVECNGGSGVVRSTIQITSRPDPPAAPSGVMTTVNQSQFTPSTASITLTWSASSGADNYTIMVTPLLPSGQSLVSTATTSLQLTVLYNEEYSINITAQNCAGSNSTTILLIISGCTPPSPLANGSISEYSSGAVGAMLTFQCDTGYMPQEEVTSTCLSNSSWVPTPECDVVDCGVPVSANRVIIDPFNNTKFGALITFHCEKNKDSMTAVCGSDGEWIPNPASLVCEESGNTPSGSGNALFTTSQLIITAIVCSLVCLVFGAFIGALIVLLACLRYVQNIKKSYVLTSSSPTPPAALAPVVYEEVSPDSHTERKNDIELNENVAYGPVANIGV